MLFSTSRSLSHARRGMVPVLAVFLTNVPSVQAQSTAETIVDRARAQLPNLWDLAVQGGWFMIPIAIASVVTLTFTLERIFGLRSGRILPRRLIRNLRNHMKEGTLDPKKIWAFCEERPSPLANALKAAILKVGRPQAELEKAVEDAVGRETAEMSRNLRPINVVASIAPLLGLLGTVQGMIMAFMVTSTTTSTGTAKAQELAHGIYTALVTTFAGLCVAVVSVILASYLEGRIERRLRQLEALFLDLLPQLEKFEGRIRTAESSAEGDNGLLVRSVRSSPKRESVADKSAATERRTARGSDSVRPASEAAPAAPSEAVATLRANFNR